MIKCIFMCLLVSAISGSCSTFRQIQSPRQYGTYRDNVVWGGFFARKFVINNDNTFTYRFRGDLLSDTSSGSYYLVKDTIFFNYYINNYDSIKKVYAAINKPIPLDFALTNNSSHLRPEKLLWKGDRMYYFHVWTGKLVKTGIERGKEVEIYLELTK